MPDFSGSPQQSFYDQELDLLEHIKLWYNTYMSVRERAIGIVPGTLARPRSWFSRQSFSSLPGYEWTPTIIVVSTGTPEIPHRHGTGRYDAMFRFAVAVIVHAPEMDLARELAGHHQTALLNLILRQKRINEYMRLNNWVGIATDDLEEDTNRSLASIRLDFDYLVTNFANADGGPLTVPDDPSGPIPDPATVEHVEINIESVGVPSD